MNIRVDNKGFTFCDHRFIYNLYYFEGDEWDAPSNAETFKRMLLKWAAMLQKHDSVDGPLFLPFAPDDEEIESLKVTFWEHDIVTFSWVELCENGWAVNFSDVESFNSDSHQVARQSPEFGEVYKDELITALINAEVVNIP